MTMISVTLIDGKIIIFPEGETRMVYYTQDMMGEKFDVQLRWIIGVFEKVYELSGKHIDVYGYKSFMLPHLPVNMSILRAIYPGRSSPDRN